MKEGLTGLGSDVDCSVSRPEAAGPGLTAAAAAAVVAAAAAAAAAAAVAAIELGSLKTLYG